MYPETLQKVQLRKKFRIYQDYFRTVKAKSKLQIKTKIPRFKANRK